MLVTRQLLALGLFLSTTTLLATEREALLSGATTCELPKFTTNLSVYHPEAIVVISEPAGDEAMPLIAAAPLGRGRFVAMGHDAYLQPKHLEHVDTGAIIKQLFLWAGKTKPDNATSMKIGMFGCKGLADALKSKGFAIRDLEGKIATGVEGLDLVVGVPYTMSSSDASALLNYVRKGGGLVLAAHGWGWAARGENKGKKVADFPANKISTAAGIAWTEEITWTDYETPPAISADSPALNASSALTLIRTTPVKSIPKETLSCANYNLRMAATVAPSDDKIFLPELKSAIAQQFGGQPVVPSKQNKISDQTPLAKLVVTLETNRLQSMPVDKLEASPMASSFPGIPPKSAPRETKVVEIDPKTPRWHSTGMFAAAGEVVTVNLPKMAVNAGLKLRIGTHKDKIWHLDRWERAPEVTREFDVDNPTMSIGTPFGGLIYLVVPENCGLKPFQMKIAGAVSAPRYIFGVTTQEQWKTERTYQAPWAEIGSDKLIFTVPTSDIVNLENPQQLMTFWNKVMDADADLAAIPYDLRRRSGLCLISRSVQGTCTRGIRSWHSFLRPKRW